MTLRSLNAKNLLNAAICACLLTVLTFSPVLAAQFSYTPDLAHNSVALEGIIPTRRFMNVTMPAGSIEFVDGTLAVNIVPNWSFDRVPVLQGPIIRTEVGTNGKEAVVSGVVLFIQGYWYDKYWTPGSHETVVTNAGLSTTGKITDMTATSLTVTTLEGTQVVVPLADIKELHSPRAYAFVAPVVASAAITPDQAWTADVPAVTLAPTVAPSAGPVVASLRRDPLLNMKDEGDWSNGKIWMIGTVLSLAQLSQLVPYVVLPQFSHQFWQHMNKKAFFTQTTPLPPNPAPLINGNTWSVPVPFNRSN
jgi:hypothetical protein